MRKFFIFHPPWFEKRIYDLIDLRFKDTPENINYICPPEREMILMYDMSRDSFAEKKLRPLNVSIFFRLTNSTPQIFPAILGRFLRLKGQELAGGATLRSARYATPATRSEPPTKNHTKGRLLRTTPFTENLFQVTASYRLSAGTHASRRRDPITFCGSLPS